MLLHQKVTNFNADLTYKRLKVLFFCAKKDHDESSNYHHGLF